MGEAVSNRQKLLIGAGVVGILMLVCFVGVMAVAISSPSSPATKTAQAIGRVESTKVFSSTINITPQLAPTQVATLTATPLPPSATPLPTATPLPVKVSVKQTVNVRQSPNAQATIVGKLQPNTTVTASAKSVDGQWLQVTLPDSSTQGWVAVSVVSVAGVVDSLPLASSAPQVSTTVAPNNSDDRKSYKTVDIRDLKKAPEKYRGERITLRGEVFTIEEASGVTGMQIWVSFPGASTSDRIPVVVQYLDTLPGLYEKQTVQVYGMGGGTFEGKNSFGSSISQPLIIARFVDYGKSLATSVPAVKAPTAVPPPPTAKNIPTNIQGKWQITYVGEFRDKTVYLYDSGKTAFGIWATIQLRIKNLQSGTDHISKNFGFIAADQSGKTYEDDLSASHQAAWQYCGCDTIYEDLAPGQETVIVITFDVPENTQTLTIVPTTDIFNSTVLATPRFTLANFNQVPAWKPKK